MKLYHYTSFRSFLDIWREQKLLFSNAYRLNDLLENAKYGSHGSRELQHKLHEGYRQISFTQDFCECKKGYMSLPLWAHYGDNNRGVCIEFDMELLKPHIPESVNHNPIKYVPETQTYNGSNTDECLFEKVNDWQYENEYRMICDDPAIQDISIKDAVTGIYITLNFMAAGHRYKGGRCLGILTGRPDLIHEFQFTENNNVLKPCAHLNIDSGVRGGTYQTLRHWFDSELVLTYDFLSRLLKGGSITDYHIFKSQIKCLLAGLDYNIVDGGSVATINEDREKYVKETRSRILEEICKRGVVTFEELHKMGICKECNFKK